METLYISNRSDTFFLARWLWLKKKISQTEMVELAKTKTFDELIEIISDHGFMVKVRGNKKATYAPTDSELFD